jgi:hypothetical protein
MKTNILKVETKLLFPLVFAALINRVIILTLTWNNSCNRDENENKFSFISNKILTMSITIFYTGTAGFKNANIQKEPWDPA